MSRRAPLIGALAVGLALTLVPLPAHAAGPADPEVITGDPYPGDPALEALLVGNEERRLIEVRSISNAVGWTNVNQGRPYRLVTGNTYTLVLIRRESPYTLDDLLEYAPSTFVRQPDGSYLLSENIVVEQGATLRLASKDGLVLHMESTPDAFVSIVTIGGSVEIVGTADRPVEVSGWDPVAQGPDTETADGRAYLRVTGGHASFSHVRFHDLGFWSGATGGIALTGTAPPDTLSEHAPDNRVVDVEAPSVYGTELFPVGAAEVLDMPPDLGAYSFVSADIDDVESRDNAFGMFVTSAAGVDIRDSTFSHNLVDGLVLHRGVTKTVVHNTSTSDNGVDGLRVTRAATGVQIDRLTSEANGRNGVTIEGGPLADGPSATGTPLGSYGNNAVGDSLVAGNGRYGIEVVGGRQIVLDGNTVEGHEMGIVVADDVIGVTITDNIVEDSAEHAIALRDGVSEALVQGNAVSGGEVGIYLRDASGTIDRNTITDVSNHGITLIRDLGTSTISDNSVAGRGPSAIDTARAETEPIVDGNDVGAWQGTKPLDVILRSIFQPLTLVWMLLGLIVLVTAIRGLRRRKPRREITHPYSTHVPLSDLTAGIADPRDFGREPVELHRATREPREERPGEAA
ncbi:right-handed parallel beta-helix repeat-containing protein [Protaetiibacter sp. SSC-01]|uniref:right-handed parallel beta-helix repeat-containing protein n=1 Tax=Protaetiibacter sp. SSC-01 TaxID=2759943 RepID=UPI001656961C|nr:right-handed parallel beta-helix repeat-containing protein [Protaetiibacter sp. SSC-01]QNO38630.1 right-handed parallel beta-helix repeat-containing protein [Protaetiibacter sp. SSC-01]